MIENKIKRGSTSDVYLLNIIFHLLVARCDVVKATDQSEGDLHDGEMLEGEEINHGASRWLVLRVTLGFPCYADFSGLDFGMTNINSYF